MEDGTTRAHFNPALEKEFAVCHDFVRRQNGKGRGIGGKGGTIPWVPLFFGNAADAIYMNAKDNH
jgi:hypothetical protein